MRKRTLAALALALVLATAGCSDSSSKSGPTSTPATGPGLPTGITFPPGEVGVWQCQDGRQLRLEGDAHWHYEGAPPLPGGANDPAFMSELFRCHGQELGG